MRKLFFIFLLSAITTTSTMAADATEANSDNRLDAVDIEPLQISLKCTVVDPQGKQGTILLVLQETKTPSVNITISTLSFDNFIAEDVFLITNSKYTDPNKRQFYFNTSYGYTNLLLIQKNSGWAIELAPAEWSILSGPLATGRCSEQSAAQVDLKPLKEKQLTEPAHAIVGMPPERWNWGSTEKECRIIHEDLVDYSNISVSDEGELTYIDSAGNSFQAAVERPLVSSEAGHTTAYRSLVMRNGDSELKLTFYYRQGRFWIDGQYSVVDGEPDWFKGVCISDLERAG